ncbi:DUF2938 family protein [Pseudophaeobacter flagellatus]|uniref:DUF2938 family protein n=1 Tax=Pseudophaeobacter flagellatus TaxID=2899119 RepID=UPI001E626EDE|nr:DUF2938 family protein [Pseudophaeobacter flagellatus]MCD9148447.1 DUF2938 domain-containing protein [Pseudophaeobacter flagellatus]
MSGFYLEMGRILLVGLIATGFMDLCNVLRSRLLHEKSMDWALVGRWLGQVAQGHWVLKDPKTAPAQSFDRALGWLFHYVVGVGLAGAMWLLLGRAALAEPQLLACLGFGALTVVIPMTTLQPGLGLGLAARKLPNPWAARRRSLLTHVSFGLGLYFAAAAVASVQTSVLAWPI